MTKLQFILSILPLFTADILTSLYIVKKYQPVKDWWKLPIWIVVASVVIYLSTFLDCERWVLIGVNLSVGFAYMTIKNMALGLIWHGDLFYLGRKGFDATMAKYFQNGRLLALSLAIASFVFSGFFKYVKK
jgi:hypothetical protein